METKEPEEEMDAAESTRHLSDALKPNIVLFVMYYDIEVTKSCSLQIVLSANVCCACWVCIALRPVIQHTCRPRPLHPQG